MKSIDNPENILPSSILVCPKRHYLIESYDYIGKGFRINDLKKIDLTQELEDTFYCAKCNKLYSIKELKRG